MPEKRKRSYTWLPCTSLNVPPRVSPPRLTNRPEGEGRGAPGRLPGCQVRCSGHRCVDESHIDSPVGLFFDNIDLSVSIIDAACPVEPDYRYPNSLKLDNTDRPVRTPPQIRMSLSPCRFQPPTHYRAVVARQNDSFQSWLRGKTARLGTAKTTETLALGSSAAGPWPELACSRVSS